MAIFHSYVKFPEGIWFVNINPGRSYLILHLRRRPFFEPPRWQKPKVFFLIILLSVQIFRPPKNFRLTINVESFIEMITRSILHGYFNPLVFWYLRLEYLRSLAKNLIFCRVSKIGNVRKKMDRADVLGQDAVGRLEVSLHIFVPQRSLERDKAVSSRLKMIGTLRKRRLLYFSRTNSANVWWWHITDRLYLMVMNNSWIPQQRSDLKPHPAGPVGALKQTLLTPTPSHVGVAGLFSVATVALQRRKVVPSSGNYRYKMI